MNIKRNTVLTLFILTLLVVSLLLVNLKLPAIAQSNDPIYLHGPSLTPIHMHGPPLIPVHMHSTIGVIDPYNPWETPWHELYPDYCETWTFTSWEDNGNGFLDPSDQIDLTNDITHETRWYHVDRVTVTMLLRHEATGEPIYVEYKDETWNPPLDPRNPVIPAPVCTWWHEVWPLYHGAFGPGVPYHITNWIDNGNQILDVCDYIEFEPWPGEYWHVEEYATDLILNEKVMDPIGIEWHELYPSFCNWHNTTSWEEPIEDPFPGRLSPGDQIDMINQTTREKKWYYVDRVTFTMLVTNETDPEDWMYIEYKGPFETMYDVKTTVENSTWHEVYPFYSQSFSISGWTDNCNGVLDSCDMIELWVLGADIYLGWWHVEELAIDIILNEKIDDPTGIIWHELYPDCCINDYETLGWEDNGDGLLNPCDNVTLALLPTGSTEKYHVENMTLTLNLTIEDIAGQPPFTLRERIYIEYLDALYFGWEWMYYPKTHPNHTDWEVICPTDRFGYPLTIENWYDNCNGVLSYCDMLELLGPDGSLWCHVDDVSVDITVKKIVEEPPPPPPWYMKPPYPDYAISGMPDFDQRQAGRYIWQDQGGRWSHCGPVAVANSLWWLDSEFEPNNTPPPTIIDNYPMVQAYGAWDDHDPRNVQPLVEHLAYLMDTDGLRTGILKLGTNVSDMQAGITHYLSWSGVNPLGDVDGDGKVTINDSNIVSAAMGTVPGAPGWDLRADIFPVTTGYPPVADNIIDINDANLVAGNLGRNGTFYERTVMAPLWELIVEEVLRCEDVVLLIAPWIYDDPFWYRYDEGAHFVTVAGLNATTWEIVLSDPINDNAEAGGPGIVPIPHIHPGPEPPYVTHNNASLVSHDMYQVIHSPCPGGPLALLNYSGSISNPLGAIWQIEAAVITSPLEVHDIAVTNLTSAKSVICQGCLGNITATVENQGDSTENFNVTLYANTTIIGEQAVSLSSGGSTDLVFTWNATGFSKGNYTLKAVADTVPGETDTTDNTYIDGWVIISMLGDITGPDVWPDGKVDMRDVGLVARYFGQTAPPAPIICDVVYDGKIDMRDIGTVARHFGQTDP